MPTLYWNLDSNLVTAAAFDSSALFLEDTRGSVSLRVICTRGDVNSGAQVLLGTDQTVGIVLRDPSNLKGAGNLAGPTTFTRGPTAADGYIATVSTDTSVVRNIMHVDDTAPELPQYLAGAVLYAEPTSGDALESLPFSWTILPRYYETDLPPADLVATWPSPTQLTAAVAAAAAALHDGDSPTFAGLTVDGGTATFEGGVEFSSNSPITLHDGDFNGALLVFDSNSYPVSLVLSAGQALRRKADDTGFEGFNPLTLDGSGFTNLDPSHLSAAVPVNKGGTGASDAATARANLGLSTVAASGAFADLSGRPVAGTDYVSSAQVDTRIQAVVGAAPSALDTLAEIATQLQSDENAAAALTTTVAGKANAADPRFAANVTGIRLSAGAGSTDRAAVARADLAPFYNTTGFTFGPYGNGTNISYGSGISGWYGSPPTTFHCNAESGFFGVNIPAGTYTARIQLATITFATAYSGLEGPLFAQVKPRYLPSGNLQFDLPQVDYTSAHATFDQLVITYTSSGSSITFYLENVLETIGSGTSFNLAVEYRISPV